METIWAWTALAFGALYVVYRILSKLSVNVDYQRELNDVLHKEEHKVKGRFE